MLDPHRDRDAKMCHSPKPPLPATSWTAEMTAQGAKQVFNKNVDVRSILKPKAKAKCFAIITAMHDGR